MIIVSRNSAYSPIGRECQEPLPIRAELYDMGSR